MKNATMIVACVLIWTLTSTGTYVLLKKLKHKQPPVILWPNEPKNGDLWHTVFILTTTNGPVELGMRSDGVVVWRHSK